MNLSSTDIFGLRSTCPIWSPDGKYLIFSSNRNDKLNNTAPNQYGDKFYIYAVSVDPPYTVTRVLDYQMVLPRFGWFPYSYQ